MFLCISFWWNYYVLMVHYSQEQKVHILNKMY
nr:MAG TPA: hypothetical protein [Caudoviricetes sp.]